MTQAAPALDLQAQAQIARQHRMHLAHDDVNTFIEMVMQDEFTGKPVEQSGPHDTWHAAASKYDRLVLFAHIESGKTNQMSIGRPLWELGRNPNLRVAVVSNTYHQAEKVVRTIGDYVEQSDMVHRIFPDLAKAEPWTHSQITVKRQVIAKEPSVQAVGVHGNILGARLDLVILDDVLDYENTLTARQREDLWNWYLATIVGRLTAHARVIAIGTAWHPQDLLHRLEKKDEWHAMRMPVLDATGAATWPERWSMDRIDTKRIELGPLEFARQMMCLSRDDSEARFKREWIDACMELGVNCYPADSATDFFRKHPKLAPPDWEWKDDDDAEEALEAAAILLGNFEGKFYTGVDLAVQRHDAADESCLFTIYVHPNGRRQVVECVAGKWTGPEIVAKILSVHERFGSIVIVENNAAQDFILQFVREHGGAIPLLPFTTGKNKAHPEFGVESIAAEFAAFKWVIPSEHGKALDSQMQEWVQELLYYDPRGHTGDRVMASWFARELARRAAGTAPQVATRVLG